MEVTQGMVDKARLRGACEDGIPNVGTSLDCMSQEHLEWAYCNDVLSLSELEALGDAPLWSQSRSGYGDGSGSGYGYGDGGGVA